MNLNGTFTFQGTRQDVWDLLQDPVVLAKALPGTERLTKVGDDRYEGVMKASIGPVTEAQFAMNVTLTDKTPPERYTMTIDGRGTAGYVRGTAKVELQDAAEGTTLMQYTSEVHVGGRIAAVGQRLLDSVAKMMARQALDSLNRELRLRLDARDKGV